LILGNDSFCQQVDEREHGRGKGDDVDVGKLRDSFLASGSLKDKKAKLAASGGAEDFVVGGSKKRKEG
jgi:hypothetical protein